jgi:hypothetical protein
VQSDDATGPAAHQGLVARVRAQELAAIDADVPGVRPHRRVIPPPVHSLHQAHGENRRLSFRNDGAAEPWTRRALLNWMTQRRSRSPRLPRGPGLSRRVLLPPRAARSARRSNGGGAGRRPSLGGCGAGKERGLRRGTPRSLTAAGAIRWCSTAVTSEGARQASTPCGVDRALKISTSARRQKGARLSLAHPLFRAKFDWH